MWISLLDSYQLLTRLARYPWLTNYGLDDFRLFTDSDKEVENRRVSENLARF